MSFDSFRERLLREILERGRDEGEMSGFEREREGDLSGERWEREGERERGRDERERGER